MHPDLAPLVAGHGVVARRTHPALCHAMDAALKAGELVRVLPGAYARPSEAGTVLVRARAVHLVDPDAVVTAHAAAHLLGWEGVPPRDMVVATRRQPAPVPGIIWERRPLDRTLSRLLDGYRIASKALVALDLSDSVEDAVERALRHGVTPEALQAALALTPNRRGNGTRRMRLAQTRDRPWSVLERKAHAHLRRAGVRGWQANRAIHDRRGERIGYGDLVFAAHGLVIELDGRLDHSRPADRARDQARDLAFARAGWEVVRIPSSMVLRTPREFVAAVTDILATRAGRR